MAEVYIKHPKSKGVGVCSEFQYEHLYKAKGFEVVDEEAYLKHQDSLLAQQDENIAQTLQEIEDGSFEPAMVTAEKEGLVGVGTAPHPDERDPDDLDEDAPDAD